MEKKDNITSEVKHEELQKRAVVQHPFPQGVSQYHPRG
jgi:hypothetical protein